MEPTEESSLQGNKVVVVPGAYGVITAKPTILDLIRYATVCGMEAFSVASANRVGIIRRVLVRVDCQRCAADTVCSKDKASTLAGTSQRYYVWAVLSRRVRNRLLSASVGRRFNPTTNVPLSLSFPELRSTSQREAIPLPISGYFLTFKLLLYVNPSPDVMPVAPVDSML